MKLTQTQTHGKKMEFIFHLTINYFKRIKYLFLSLTLTLIVVFNNGAILATPPNLEIAQSLTQQGFLQLYNGQSEAALKAWQSAYRAYEQLNNKQGMNGSLINQSLALQALGSYANACQVLTQALALENRICPHALKEQTNSSQILSDLKEIFQKQPIQNLQIIGFSNLANVFRAMGEPEVSYTILQYCLTFAAQLQKKEIQDNLLLNLANTEVTLYNQAKSKYQLTDDFTAQKKALILAKSKFDAAQKVYEKLSNSPSTVSLQAKLNWLKLLIDNTSIQLSQYLPLSNSVSRLINDILTNLKQIETLSKVDSIYSKLKLSHNLLKITQSNNLKVKQFTDNNLQSIALSLSQEALASAKKLNNFRAIAYANSTLGEIYAAGGELSKAESSYHDGMLYAQSVQAWDIVYQWQWELARLYKTSGKIEQANKFYSTAIKNLDKVRGDVLLFNSDIQFAFTEKVEPLYREYISLLLNKNNSNKNYNRQAIKIQEQLKFAEVENFLRCGKFAENALDARLDSGLKDLDYIVYLIKLDDRVEVLVKTSQNIYRHTIDLDIIGEPLTNFFNIIQNLEFVDTKGYNFLTYSQAVYQLLIQPIKQYLPSSGKIGFVLDSYFQNLPLDMLYDGQQYLLETYIISVGSSAKQLRQSMLKPAATLASGVSKIGPSFSNPIVPRDLRPLPQVRLEIENIKKANPSAITLLDSEFTHERFSKDIENNSFWAIHLSSHAQFSSDIEQTFVLAWDTPLMVNDLKALLQNKSNLDLLVLSACQTAKGDRRSFLGIAGIAAQAGARSVLASLWLVDADSTAQLMTQFYEGLKSGLTKAEALRSAQLSLLKSDKYFHPYYWSAFILVGG
ncbi:TPR repeat (plasmid) [Nostoc punctiforme PCC 73102]|uniref:TPR repeat n=1 Tax=Nostoc punctiforme (strain ATCC 29133 / PCC 73102) TaxID=63737 RepID=B2JBJ8_NOSP7|nr:TPR repeat [Nostoc punctiforme PCC 73102]